MAWAEVVASREPRPGLLGLELEPFPYASAFSLLLRVTRLMDLAPSEWFQSLGLRYNKSVGAMPNLGLGRVSRTRFEAVLGLTDTKVPMWWSEEVWSPLRTGGLLDRTSRPIRWCWHCASYGYHTTLFQLPSIHSCPWHASPLLDACPMCHKPGLVPIDAQGRIGRCDCGFDWLMIDRATVDMWSFPTAQAEAWMATYLVWAAEQRERRVMVAPQGSDRWVDGFAVLAQPPHLFSKKCGDASGIGMRKEEFKEGPSEDPPAAHFWGWGALADQRPLTYVPLPSMTLSDLTRVTKQVIARLPQGAKTPLRLASFSDLDADAALGENAAQRPECFIAPHGRNANGSTWLNVSAVDLNTLQLCGQLVDGVIEACDPEPDEGDFSRQAARAKAVGRITGRWRLAEALNSILAQGYAQGLDALLRASFDLPRSKSWWLPVAEFEGEPGSLARIRICWILAPPPRLRRPPQLPPPSRPKVRPRRTVRQRQSTHLKAARRKEVR